MIRFAEPLELLGPDDSFGEQAGQLDAAQDQLVCPRRIELRALLRFAFRQRERLFHYQRRVQLHLIDGESL